MIIRRAKWTRTSGCEGERWRPGEEERERKRERERKGERVLGADSRSSASEQLPGKHNLQEIAITDEYKRSRNKRTCYMLYFHLISLVHP